MVSDVASEPSLELNPRKTRFFLLTIINFYECGLPNGDILSVSIKSRFSQPGFISNRGKDGPRVSVNGCQQRLTVVT